MAKRASDIALQWIGVDKDEDRSQMVLDNLCAGIAEAICEARQRAGLTQSDLARRIGTSQSAIARVENADYDGHSLRTIAKIANALNLNVTLRFDADPSAGSRDR
jgi:transcriptional regulator with XRE-family HTH domain